MGPILARGSWTSLVIALVFVGSLVPLEPEQATRISAPVASDLAAIHENMRLPRATYLNDRDGDKVFDSLETRFAAEPGRPQSLIVTFRHGVAFDAALAHARDASGGVEPTYVYPMLGAYNAHLTLPQALAVAGLDEVRQVEWSQPGERELDTATVNFGADATVDSLMITGDADGASATFTANDTVIAILDTGFHGEHADLQGKFVAFVDALDKKVKEPYDEEGHGTHVASIAAGLGAADAAYRGVAPGAALVGIKIVGPNDVKAATLWGIDWLLANQEAYNIRISTISFGFGATMDGTDALELAFDKVWAAGIVAFKSTGNSGPEKGTVTVPGGARGILAVASMLDPGRTDGTIGATPVTPGDYDYGFHLSTYSSRGPTADGRIKPDLAAPGQSITAAEAGTRDGYVVFSGTSMASPFAAGTAALILTADPTLKPDDVRRILIETAEDWGTPGPDIDYGNGRIDTLRAVQMARIAALARDGASFAELEAVANVSGPDLPFHASGVVASGRQAAEFAVEDVGLPVAVTVLHQSGMVDAVARLVLAQVLGPDDVVVGKVALSPTDRHQVIAFAPTSTGTHTIQLENLANADAVSFDVSAGLPPPEVGLPTLLPDPAGYIESVEPPAEAPGFAAVLLLAGALLGAALSRRRIL